MIMTMNVVITGGAGFLGQRLTEALLSRGTLRGPDGRECPIERITLVDIASAPAADPVRLKPDTTGVRIEQLTGDVADRALIERAIGAGQVSIFHLAAVVSAMAEVDFEIGMRINVDASRTLLDVCRAGGNTPRLVFASSVAVYGGELTQDVTDRTALRPQSSYGAQKAIVELLIHDYTRRGLIDGRVLRLPTITVRPGRPNAAASSFASGIIREPLNGEATVCPVAPDTRVWVLSPVAAIDCLITGHDLSSDALGSNRSVNVPGTSVTAGEMVAALERIAGPEVAARVRWQRDPAVERIVASWPGAWDTSRARSLGFRGDASFDDIIRDYISTKTATISR
jgi:nucleoside-diphosphate-sugar epimerase